MAQPPFELTALSTNAAWSDAGDSQLANDGEDRRDWRAEAGDAVAEREDLASSPAVSTVGGTGDRGEQLPQSSAVHAGRVKATCRLCGEQGGEQLEALYPSPCRCRNTYVHLSCVENRLKWVPEEATCPSCRVPYRVQRRAKSIWYWFLGRETRLAAILFVANILFSLVNVVVVVFAWMYTLFEDHPNAWISTPALASMLFPITIFWAAFGCFRFYIFYKPLARWKKENTTFTVLLGGDRVEHV